MVNQGRNNLQAPWLGITSFLTLGLMLGLLVFVGEAIRDSLDPRKHLIKMDKIISINNLCISFKNTEVLKNVNINIIKGKQQQ